MSKKTGPSNEHLVQLIQELRKVSTTQKAELWDRIADDLCMSTRQRRVVNISRINRSTNPNETVIVPGKVLGSGAVDHSITVAAWTFSASAKQRIHDAKGKTLSINELMKQNPQGKNIRILG
ncbi:50S ribosomal protein L18e [Candidatus Woesearchaeota archaeon]|nr:50S ribosomal protein L18e [Candidatus Woesearchaeota archaeon]